MVLKVNNVLLDLSTHTEISDFSGTRHNFTPFVKTMFRNRDGTRNPRWKSQVEAGANATTAMTGVFENIIVRRGNYLLHVKDNVGGDIYYRAWRYPIQTRASTVSGGSFPTSKAYNLALAKYYAKIREAAVQFSGPIFLGEAAETRRMLRRPAEALYDSARNFLDAVRRKKRLNPRTWPSALAGLWLENTFGWQPLLNDIQDAAKAQRRLRQARHINIAASYVDSGMLTDNGTLHASLGTGSGTSNIAMQCLVTDRTIARASFRFKGALWAQADMTTWQKNELFGFTPSEFIPTAWELLPWSFLADYFTNIGDILSSAVTDTSVVRWTNLTSRVSGIRYYSAGIDTAFLVSLYGNKYVSSSGYPGSFIASRHEVSRYTNAGLYMPSFVFELPGSTKKLLNIVALLQLARTVHPQNGPSRPYHPGMYG